MREIILKAGGRAGKQRLAPLFYITVQDKSGRLPEK